MAACRRSGVDVSTCSTSASWPGARGLGTLADAGAYTRPVPSGSTTVGEPCSVSTSGDWRRSPKASSRPLVGAPDVHQAGPAGPGAAGDGVDSVISALAGIFAAKVVPLASNE